MKKWISVFVAAVFLTLPVIASTIHTFSDGERLTAANLNSVFQHIHNTMVGGHGARLVDADVNAAAGISFSKLQTPALIPKAWLSFITLCGVGVCTETIDVSTGVTSLGHTAVGKWTLTWATARADQKYVVMLTPANNSILVTCNKVSWSTTVVNIECRTTASALVDVNFDVLMLDNL